jgi:hypothetical protein
MAIKIDQRDGAKAILAIFVEDLKTASNEFEPMQMIVLKWHSQSLLWDDFEGSLQFAMNSCWVKLRGTSIAMTDDGYAAA